MSPVKGKKFNKKINKMEMINLPDAELKTLVIRVFNDLSENFNKDLGT